MDFNFLDDLPDDTQVSSSIDKGKDTVMSAMLGGIEEEPSQQPQVISADKFRQRREAGELSVVPPLNDELGITTSDTPFKPMIPNESMFDPRLAFEVALDETPLHEIYPRYDLTELEWDDLRARPSFKQAVMKYREDILENGASFRFKARIQAEAYLKDAHLLIKNASTPPTVKADMIKWMAKMGDLEPRNNDAESAPSFALQINLNV